MKTTLTLYPCRIGAEYGLETRLTPSACATNQQRLAQAKRGKLPQRQRGGKGKLLIAQEIPTVVAAGLRACEDCPGCVKLAEGTP